MGRSGQIDEAAAQNSWSGSGSPDPPSDYPRPSHAVSQPGDPRQSPAHRSPSGFAVGSTQEPEPLIRFETQQPLSTNNVGGSNQSRGDSLGMFNPFFQDTKPEMDSSARPSAAPATRPTRAVSNTVELDPLLVPSSTPVDQSILSSGDMSGFDMDLVAALSKASFGSPQGGFYSESPTIATPPNEAGFDPVKNVSGLTQNVGSGEALGSSETTSSTSTSSSSHAMSPGLQFVVDSPARPAASSPSDMLGSAVNAAMQVAQATAAASLQNVELRQVDLGSPPPPGEMKQGGSVSSLLSDLSD